MSSPKLPGEGGGRSAGGQNAGGQSGGGRSAGSQHIGAVGDAAAADPEVAAIQAEISDHLTTAAERLEAAGASPAESRQAAAASFGDVGEVGRRVYWIRRGDALLWRGAIALLVAGLAVSLLVVSIRSWQAESRMAGEIGALTEQLQKLAERQAQTPVVPAPPATPAPLEITGTAYIGAPDRPAASVPIELIDVQTGKTVRQFTSDAAGKFNTGPLAGGDYALVAEVLQDAPKSEQPLMVQSAPINAYPGVAIPPQTLDLSFPYGRLAIELSRPLPTFETKFEGETTQYETRLFIKVKTPSLRAGRWSVEQDALSSWPVFLSSGSRAEERQPPEGVGSFSGPGGFVRSFAGDLWTPTSPPRTGLWFFEILDERELASRLQGTLFQSSEGMLPSGECQMVAEVLIASLEESTTANKRADDTPQSAELEVRTRIRQTEIGSISRFGPLNLRTTVAADVVSDDERWLGIFKSSFLSRLPREPRPPRRRQELASRELESFGAGSVALVPIERNSLTTIRIEIPEDLRSWIQEILDQPTQEERTAAYERKYPFLRPAKITVVGTAPLPPVEE